MFELVMQDIVPLLGLAVAGIAGGRFLDFKQGSEKVLTHFVLWLAGPSALILAIQNTTVDALLDASVSFTSLLVFSVTYIGTLVVHRYVLGHGIAAGSIAACCTTSMNLIMIGLPITLSVAGDEAAAVVAISALLSLVVFVPITVALLSPAHPEQSSVTQFFGHIADSLGNPLVIGTLIGLLILSFQLTIPSTVEVTLGLLKEASVPVGMVALGLTVNSIGLRSINREVVLMCGTKMLLAPAIALGAAYLFRLPPDAATALVVLFSCPPALHSYILASEYGTYEQESDGIILLSILVSTLSIPAFIYACRSIWMIA